MKQFVSSTTALALLALLAVPASSASAQDRPVRVATVDMPRVFQEIQERKDVEARLRQEQSRLAAEQKGKLEELAKLKAEGGNYRPGSEQHEDWRQRHMRAQIAQQAWAETAKREMDWRLKRQTRDIFDRITATVREYANSNGIDLVLADHQPTLSDDELDTIPADRIGQVMDRRRVIYASKNADISDAIIAALDARYKAGGGQGGGGQGPVGQGPGGNAPNANPAGAAFRGNEGPGSPRQSPSR